MSDLSELDRARDAVVEAAIREYENNLASRRFSGYSGGWTDLEWAIDRLLAARAAQGRTA